MKPIALFFLANLVYFLFPLFSTFNNSLQSQITDENFVHSRLANQMVMDKIKEREISLEEYAITYNIKTSELSKLLLITMAVFIGLFFSLIHIKSDLSIADHFVVSLELMTFVILFAVQLQGGILLLLHSLGLLITSSVLNEVIISSTVSLMLLYFFFKMQTNFYGVSGWKAILNSLLCFVSFAFVLFAYRAFLFYVTFWSF